LLLYLTFVTITAGNLTEEGGSNLKLGKMLNEELHNLYSSLNIVRFIKLSSMRWAEQVVWDK
jgi:hypothetical protein